METAFKIISPLQENDGLRATELVHHGTDAPAVYSQESGGRFVSGLGFKFPHSSHHFSERMHLEVGPTTFELLHLSGHTGGNIGDHLPDEKVFFAGDAITNGYYPSLIEAFPLQRVQAMDDIGSMDIETIVPGHGKVCEVDYVREFSEFLETNIENMNRLIGDGLT